MAVSDLAALRYAQAYFDVAAEERRVDGLRAGLATAAARLGAEEVRGIFSNPRVDRTQRAAVAESLLEGADAAARNLVRLLVDRGRIDLLPRILEQFDRLADRASGRIRAEVTSAVALDHAQERRLRDELARHLGGEVQTTVRQDPSIIGGLVVRIGDRVIDSSVRTRLRELQGALA